MPNFMSHWFLADPRRLCVLGVWLYLLGTATLFLSLIDGMSPTGLTGGFLLAWCGGSGLLALMANIAIGGGLSLLLAIISWHLMERPLLTLKDRLTR